MWQNLRYNVPITEAISYGSEMIIKGTAINATVTRNGIKYTEEELRNSAHTLRNKPILKDHNNSVDSIVGRTTMNVNYNEAMKKVDFEGKIIDEMVYKKIKAGIINSVSVGAHVLDIVDEKLDDGTEIGVAKGISFVELSLVGIPADPGALIENGFAHALTEAWTMKQKEMPKPEAVKHEEAIQETKEKIEPVVQEVVTKNEIQEGANMEGVEKEKFETQIKEKDAVIEKLQKEIEDAKPKVEEKVNVVSQEPIVEQKVEEKIIEVAPTLIEKAQEQVIKIEQTEELKGKVNNEVEVKTSALDGYEIVKADSGYGFFKKEFSQKRLVR